MRKSWTGFEGWELIPTLDEALQELTKDKFEFDNVPLLAELLSRFPKGQQVKLLYTRKHARDGQKEGFVQIDDPHTVTLFDSRCLIVTVDKIVNFSNSLFVFVHEIIAHFNDGRLNISERLSPKHDDMNVLDVQINTFVDLLEV